MKRVWIAIVVFCVALAGVIVWQVARSREPVYKGRTLTSWVRDYIQIRPGTSGNDYAVNEEAREAIKNIGTNGIPTLLGLLRAKDSALKVKTMGLLRRQRVVQFQFKDAPEWQHLAMEAFIVLGTNAQTAVPELVDIVNQHVSPSSTAFAVQTLGWIGPAAKPAVPDLTRWATNADSYLQSMARWSLLRIDPEAVIKAGITNAP